MLPHIFFQFIELCIAKLNLVGAGVGDEFGDQVGEEQGLRAVGGAGFEGGEEGGEGVVGGHGEEEAVS